MEILDTVVCVAVTTTDKESSVGLADLAADDGVGDGCVCVGSVAEYLDKISGPVVSDVVGVAVDVKVVVELEGVLGYTTCGEDPGCSDEMAWEETTFSDATLCFTLE